MSNSFSRQLFIFSYNYTANIRQLLARAACFFLNYYKSNVSYMSKLFCYADYKIINKIGEGTFSEVVKAQNLKDGKYYACKTMKQSLSR